MLQRYGVSSKSICEIASCDQLKGAKSTSVPDLTAKQNCHWRQKDLLVARLFYESFSLIYRGYTRIHHKMSYRFYLFSAQTIGWIASCVDFCDANQISVSGLPFQQIVPWHQQNYSSKSFFTSHITRPHRLLTQTIPERQEKSKKPKPDLQVD